MIDDVAYPPVGTLKPVTHNVWVVDGPAINLILDLATVRDRARSRAAQRVYGVLALGWTGSTRQWHALERDYWAMAAVAVPLVVSVLARSVGIHTSRIRVVILSAAVFGIASGCAMQWYSAVQSYPINLVHGKRAPAQSVWWMISQKPEETQ